MNWSNILSECFFAALVTDAAGTIMLLVWFLCRKFLQNKSPKLVYFMLRWVVMMYILPITYFAIKAHYNTGYVQDVGGVRKTMFIVDMNNLWYQGFAIMWMISIAAVGAVFIKNEADKIRICRNNYDDGISLTQTEFERIKDVLEIKGKVTLLRNDGRNQCSPFVIGILHRKVVVPFGDYSEKELKVILYHELTHVKKSDVLFRYLTMIAIVLNSMNPISYLLWSAVLLWSEADCDARALDALEKEGISKKDYYRIIWDIFESGPKGRTLQNYPMLLGAKESLVRRMDIMKKYRVNVKKMATSAAIAWTLVFAIFSSVTAHAAGIGIAEANDAMLKENQVVGYFEDATNPDGSWSDVMEIEETDPVNIVYINDGIMTLGGGSIDWYVPVGTRYVTSAMYFTAGTEVHIACTATPTDALFWFGIMHPSSAVSVVEGTGSGGRGFVIPSNGYYRVLVENRSNVEIHAGGYYQY